MAEVIWIAYHHTGTGSGRPDVWNTARYQTDPKAHLQFPSIAYAVYIEPDGTKVQCQDMETVTWHVGTNSPSTRDGIGIYNWQAIGVCFSGENPTLEQIVSMREAGDDIDTYVGRKLERVGHRIICGPGSTECPGWQYEQWIGGLR